MTTNNFGMGFFGRNPFDREARKQFQEDWSKMTDQEKLDFMNKRMEQFGKDPFSVEQIDARCQEWMNKTPEEKQSFVDERKKAFENRMNCRGRHFHHHHFGYFEAGK